MFGSARLVQIAKFMALGLPGAAVFEHVRVGMNLDLGFGDVAHGVWFKEPFYFRVSSNLFAGGLVFSFLTGLRTHRAEPRAWDLRPTQAMVVGATVLIFLVHLDLGVGPKSSSSLARARS